MKTDFWAQLCYDDGSHGGTRISPVFAGQNDLNHWIREHRSAGVEVTAWRRESSDGSYRDHPLGVTEPFERDTERLTVILAPVRAALDAKRAEHRTRLAMPKGFKSPEERLRAQALAAAARAAARRGAAIAEPPSD